MKKLLALLLLVSSFAFGGQVTGTISTATSGPIQNATLTLTPTQAFVVAGTATVVSSPVACYTDGNGNVVGEPNPLVAPVVTTNTASGTLAANTYFIRFTYYDASGESVASFETTTLLGSTGTLIVTPPTRQPATATGIKIYIGTVSGSETLQSTQVGFPTYQQSSALVAGSALPSSNTSACKPFFNDQGSPVGGYNVTLTNSSGATISGFPQKWQLMGGAAGTVNLSNGTPLWNGFIQYPQAIVTTPAFNATQSIAGGLNLNGNPLTGVSSLAVSSASVSGAITGQSLDNTIFADQIAGADMCAKITAAAAIIALRAIPTGIIDARGFQGTQSCPTAPVLSVASGLLMIGNVNIQLTSSASAWTIPHGWFVIGPWNRADGSGTQPGLHFQAVTGFPTSTTAMVTVGTATAFDEGPTLMNAWVDCNGIAAKGITSSTINEKGGIKRVIVSECTGTHVSVVSGGAGQPQNFVIDELEILTTATNVTGQTALSITANGNSFGQVSNITVVGKPTSKFQNCVTVDSYTGGKMFHVHCEQAVDALTLCTGGTTCNGGSFDDISGDPGVTNSIVHIKTGTQAAHLTSVSQQGTPGTTAHTIIDDVNTLNYDGFTIPSFDASTSNERTITHYLTADKGTKSPVYDDNSGAASTSGVYNTKNNVVILAARNAANNGDEQLFGVDAFGDANICASGIVACQLLSPVKLGASGNLINNALNGTATLTYTAIAAQTSQEQTMSITNASATNFGVFCSPRATLGNANISWSAWVSSAGTVSVRVTNPTVGSVTPSAVAWGCSVFQ